MNQDNREIVVGVQKLVSENEGLKEELRTLQSWKEDAIKWLEKGNISAALDVLDHGCPF